VLQIGHELDALERAVLEDASGMLSNLDESGMFSIQVLSKALAVWNLQAIQYDSEEIKKDPRFDPLRELAFICNLQVGTRSNNEGYD
jgi:ataxin-3